jgi:DNA-binding MarR family transcriptional regulator
MTTLIEARRAIKAVCKAGKAEGVSTEVEVGVLLVLDEATCSLTATALWRRLSLSTGSLTIPLAWLESKGLLTRRPGRGGSGADVRITDAGREVCARVRERLTEPV